MSEPSRRFFIQFGGIVRVFLHLALEYERVLPISPLLRLFELIFDASPFGIFAFGCVPQGFGALHDVIGIVGTRDDALLRKLRLRDRATITWFPKAREGDGIVLFWVSGASLWWFWQRFVGVLRGRRSARW
jgi:hypothetical protein